VFVPNKLTSSSARARRLAHLEAWLEQRYTAQVRVRSLVRFRSLRSNRARYVFAQAAAGWEKHAHSDSELARIYGRDSSWGRAEVERAARSRAANKRTEKIERKRLEVRAQQHLPNV
jgi:predicted DNA-binding WGR domain protein